MSLVSKSSFMQLFLVGVVQLSHSRATQRVSIHISRKSMQISYVSLDKWSRRCCRFSMIDVSSPMQVSSSFLKCYVVNMYESKFLADIYILLKPLDDPYPLNDNSEMHLASCCRQFEPLSLNMPMQRLICNWLILSSARAGGLWHIRQSKFTNFKSSHPLLSCS